MEPDRVAEREGWGKLSFRGWFLRRTVNPVRLAFQLHDRGAVHDSIQERHRERRVAEIVGPGLEVDVRHQGSADSLAARVDDLVPQARCLRTDSTFDAVEAEPGQTHQNLPNLAGERQAGDPTQEFARFSEWGTRTGVSEWETGVAKNGVACFSFFERRHSTHVKNPGKVAAGEILQTWPLRRG
jgi:hypothetical protein